MNTPLPDQHDTLGSSASSACDDPQLTTAPVDHATDAEMTPEVEVPEQVAAPDHIRQPKADRTQQIITLIVVVLIVLSFALLVYSVASGATDPKDASDMTHRHLPSVIAA